MEGPEGEEVAQPPAKLGILGLGMHRRRICSGEKLLISVGPMNGPAFLLFLL